MFLKRGIEATRMKRGFSPQLKEALGDVIEDLTPENLFFFTNNANGFEQLFEERYKAVRERWLRSTQEVLKADKETIEELIMSEKIGYNINDFKRKLRGHKEKLTKIEYATCEREIGAFNNGEIKIKCKTNVAERSVDVMYFLGQDVSRSNEELELVLDLLNRAGVEEVSVYAPFLPYQREDKKDEGRVPLSAKALFKKIETAANGKLKRIVTLDIHSPQAQGFSEGAVDTLSAVTLFARYLVSKEFYEQNKVEITDLTIVSGDAGGAKRAKKLADILGVDYVIYDKSRPKAGEVEFSRNQSVYIKTPYAVWIDDMIDTGSTLCDSAEAARTEFKLKGVFALATHGIFSPKIKSGIETKAEKRLRETGIKVVVTDTLPRTEGYYEENKDWLIDVISVADLFANVALKRRLASSVSTYLAKQERRVIEAVNTRQKLSMDDYLIRCQKSFTLPSPTPPSSARSTTPSGSSAYTAQV